VLARAVDLHHVGHEVLLGALAELLLQHLAVADDGVQRGAQLVAHVGQEGALGPAGVLGGVHRRHQRLLDALALRDVHDRAHRAHDAAGGVGERGAVHGGPEALPVLLAEAHLVLLGDALHAQGHALRVGRPVLLGHQELGHVPAHHGLALVARDLGHARVHVDDAVVGVGDDDALPEGLHGEAEPRVELAERVVFAAVGQGFLRGVRGAPIIRQGPAFDRLGPLSER